MSGEGPATVGQRARTWPAGWYFVTRQAEANPTTRGAKSGRKPPMPGNTATKLFDNDAEELFLAGANKEL